MFLSKGSIMIWLFASICFLGANALKSHPTEEESVSHNPDVTSGEWSPGFTDTSVLRSNAGEGREMPTELFVNALFNTTACGTLCPGYDMGDSPKAFMSHWTYAHQSADGTTQEYPCSEAAELAIKGEDTSTEITCKKVKHRCCWESARIDSTHRFCESNCQRVFRPGVWITKDNPSNCRCEESAVNRLFVYTSYTLDQCKAKCLDMSCEQIDWAPLSSASEGVGFCNVFRNNCEGTVCHYNHDKFKWQQLRNLNIKRRHISEQAQKKVMDDLKANGWTEEAPPSWKK